MCLLCLTRTRLSGGVYVAGLIFSLERARAPVTEYFITIRTLVIYIKIYTFYQIDSRCIGYTRTVSSYARMFTRRK